MTALTGHEDSVTGYLPSDGVNSKSFQFRSGDNLSLQVTGGDKRSSSDDKSFLCRSGNGLLLEMMITDHYSGVLVVTGLLFTSAWLQQVSSLQRWCSDIWSHQTRVITG